MPTRLAASDFYTYFRPSKCDLRVYFKASGKEEAPHGPYEEVLFRLGEKHEVSDLATFPKVVDLHAGTLQERLSKTAETIEAGATIIYQAVFIGTLQL